MQPRTTPPGRVDVRTLLPRVGHAFFARFAGRLRPIQQAAIPDLLDGRDAVLMAPSAAGKTEAAAAPLFERHLRDRADAGPAVLYVSPTRALANDIFRRLEAPCLTLDVALGRRTGDHPSAMRGTDLPRVLITTPESLDSLLCRCPERLRAVRALVLDELHLLLESGRGDQLSVLARRLRRVAGSPVQTAVLSATLPSPETVARRFLDAPVVHRAGGPRAIDLEILDASGPSGLASALSEAIRRLDLRKVLAFVDRRDAVEALAVSLAGRTPFGDGVLAHHGSLDRRVRERTEEQFLTRPRALCVATSTLEVGIDIGDVDAVLLLDQPASVSSFLQRIGRGNRRSGACRVLAACSGPGGRAWMQHLVERARAGDLCADPTPFRPGVVAQQAISLCLQNRAHWVSAAALAERLSPDVRSEWPNEDLEAMLLGLAEAGWLQPGGQGRWRPGETAWSAYARGRLHSVIESEAGEVEVVDELTGEALGRVAPDGPSDTIALGGRSWQKLGEREGQARVRGGARDGVPAVFRVRAGPTRSRRLCESFRQWLGLPEGAVPVLPALGGGWDVFPCAGTAACAVLAAAVRRSTGRKTGRARGLAFTWKGDDPSELRFPAPELIEGAVRAGALRLARRLGSGPFTRHVPRERVEQFAVQAVAPAQLGSAVAGWRVMPQVPEAIAVVLAELRSA
jgi:ATP-dependent Lhr-like helicase